MISRILLCLLIIGLCGPAGAQPAKPPAQINVQTLSDADATISSNITTIWTGVALTATRTVILPAASSVCKGCTITFTDLAGAINTPGNNIILDGASSDTINGRPIYTMAQPYGSVVLTSNGSNGWAAQAQADDVANAANMVSIDKFGQVMGPLTLLKMYPLPGSVQGSGATAPGAGLAALYITKGATFGTCRLVVVAGTSTTVSQIGSDFGGGC